jgi:hypothetical protein
LSVKVVLNEALTNQLEERAREIAGKSQDPLTFAWARTVAAAELDVDRVRWTKVSLIRVVSALEGLDAARISGRGSIRRFPV